MVLDQNIVLLISSCKFMNVYVAYNSTSFWHSGDAYCILLWQRLVSSCHFHFIVEVIFWTNKCLKDRDVFLWWEALLLYEYKFLFQLLVWSVNQVYLWEIKLGVVLFHFLFLSYWVYFSLCLYYKVKIR